MSRLLPFLLSIVTVSAQEVNPDLRLGRATETLRAFLSPDSNVPKYVPGNAECIVVAPRLIKGARLVGLKYGRGFASCRQGGAWTAPAAVALEGAGPQSADLILLMMSQDARKRMFDETFVLSREVIAGPVDEENGDAAMKAAVVAYALSKDSFAGVSLGGATLRPDPGENKKLYGDAVTNREILSGAEKAPHGARGFVALLNKRARKSR